MLALTEGVEPFYFTLGAVTALRAAFPGLSPGDAGNTLRGLWDDAPETEARAVITRIEQAVGKSSKA